MISTAVAKNLRASWLCFMARWESTNPTLQTTDTEDRQQNPDSYLQTFSLLLQSKLSYRHSAVLHVSSHWLLLKTRQQCQSRQCAHGLTVSEQSPPSQLHANELHSLSHTLSLALPLQSGSGQMGVSIRDSCSQRLPRQPGRHWQLKKGKEASALHVPPLWHGLDKQLSWARSWHCVPA